MLLTNFIPACIIEIEPTVNRRELSERMDKRMINMLKGQKRVSFLLGGKPFEELAPFVTVAEEGNTVTTVSDFWEQCACFY